MLEISKISKENGFTKAANFAFVTASQKLNYSFCKLSLNRQLNPKPGHFLQSCWLEIKSKTFLRGIGKVHSVGTEVTEK